MCKQSNRLVMSEDYPANKALPRPLSTCTSLRQCLQANKNYKRRRNPGRHLEYQRSLVLSVCSLIRGAEGQIIIIIKEPE